jgi:hypothetical protein
VVLLCFAMLVPLSISFEFKIRNGLGHDAYRSSIDQIAELLHVSHETEFINEL